MSWLSSILRDVGLIPEKTSGATQDQGFGAGGMSWLSPMGSVQFSDSPILGGAIGGGTYSTGLQIEPPEMPPGMFAPLNYFSPGPVPGVQQTTQGGLLPGPGGTLEPYQTVFTCAESAFPGQTTAPPLMDRVRQIGLESTRASQKYSVEGATEGPFAQFDSEGEQRTGWENKTDEEVGAYISGMSSDDRGALLPGWMTQGLLEDVAAKDAHVTRLNETMAASNLSHARTTTQMMGLLTGAMGISEYADVQQRADQMGEQVWSNFRDRGYDTSTAYASARQVAENAKSKMFGEFFDKQLARRIGTLQMGQNMMSQAFLGVQRTPPNPMALAQVIYGQVASGAGQQQPEAIGAGGYLGSMLGGGIMSWAMKALTGG